jgi:hypothetical protein
MVLLTAAGAAVGLLALAMTAMTVVFVFLPFTRALGVRRFFRPFVVVGVVSGVAALFSFAGAMDGSSGPLSIRAVLFGIAAWLVAWAILGAVNLVVLLVRYAELIVKSSEVPPQG